jgi:hypothetical protein
MIPYAFQEHYDPPPDEEGEDARRAAAWEAAEEEQARRYGRPREKPPVDLDPAPRLW